MTNEQHSVLQDNTNILRLLDTFLIERFSLGRKIGLGDHPFIRSKSLSYEIFFLGTENGNKSLGAKSRAEYDECDGNSKYCSCIFTIIFIDI